MNKVLLVDGDVVRYRCGFAAQKTRYKVTVGDNPVPVIFENAKEANTFIAAYKEEAPEKDCIRESFIETEPVENALHSVKLMMQEMQEKYPDAAMEVYFSCPTPTNWRTQLYPQYKANRPDRRPEHDAAIRDYMSSKYDVRTSDVLEADDAISLRAQELRAGGDYPITATIDKDMDQIPGLHWDFVKKEEYEITPEYADMVLEIQTITGDSTDNIPGIPGMGPAKARKALETKDAWVVYKDFYDTQEMAEYHYLLNRALVTMPADREDINIMRDGILELRAKLNEQRSEDQGD